MGDGAVLEREGLEARNVKKFVKRSLLKSVRNATPLLIVLMRLVWNMIFVLLTELELIIHAERLLFKNIPVDALRDSCLIVLAIVLCKTKKCIKTARKHIIAFRTLHCGCVYKACIKYPAIQRGKFKIKRRCKTFKSCIPYTMCKLLKGNWFVIFYIIIRIFISIYILNY